MSSSRASRRRDATRRPRLKNSYGCRASPGRSFRLAARHDARGLLERIREVVMVDTAVVLMVEGADAAPSSERPPALTCSRRNRRACPARSRPQGHRRTAGSRAWCARRTMARGASRNHLLADRSADVRRANDVGVRNRWRAGPARLLARRHQLLQLAADRAAIAIENARLYRKAEERGQAAQVLGHVADGVFLVDAKGSVQLWNRREAITGVPAGAVLGPPRGRDSWLGDARASRLRRERSGCIHCPATTLPSRSEVASYGSRSPG